MALGEKDKFRIQLRTFRATNPVNIVRRKDKILSRTSAVARPKDEASKNQSLVAEYMYVI